MSSSILRIYSSSRKGASVSRELTDKIVARLSGPDTEIATRDLTQSLPLVTETWIGAAYTPDDKRDEAQRAELAVSDALIAEVKAADTLVIGAPIYNFGVPAALKVWIDQICRVGVTFQYTAEGPKGLLAGKRAIIVIASGGVELGSDYDFASGYLRQVLGFIGITDVAFVSADRLSLDADATMKSALAQVEALAA